MHKRALLQALLLICLGWVAGEGDENAGEPIHIFTARHGHGLNTTATNYEILVNSTADDPNSLAALALENRILRKRLHDLRVEYGAIYCKLNDIGPTGKEPCILTQGACTGALGTGHLCAKGCTGTAVDCPELSEEQSCCRSHVQVASACRKRQQGASAATNGWCVRTCIT